jgi:hypothetical protein
VNDAGADARERAYAAYEARLRDAYKTPEEGNGDRRFCPKCDGAGLDQNLAECPLCHGEGTVPADYEGDEDEVLENTETHTEGMGHNRRRVDHRTVAQMMRDHQVRMSSIYEKFDHELSEAWRRS